MEFIELKKIINLLEVDKVRIKNKILEIIKVDESEEKIILKNKEKGTNHVFCAQYFDKTCRLISNKYRAERLTEFQHYNVGSTVKYCNNKSKFCGTTGIVKELNLICKTVKIEWSDGQINNYMTDREWTRNNILQVAKKVEILNKYFIINSQNETLQVITAKDKGDAIDRMHPYITEYILDYKLVSMSPTGKMEVIFENPGLMKIKLEGKMKDYLLNRDWVKDNVIQMERKRPNANYLLMSGDNSLICEIKASHYKEAYSKVSEFVNNNIEGWFLALRLER